ncbi:hypothetical protein OIU79_029795 [Salix purpurea]|uniref:F-box associated domain-containing protein n=1 Tax=Salix purpurea TaxID=77065 RepID=A0A9Q0ZW13_SALPP|nr:hypothetical protein OIU79_029795 [Salix purpurea]
MANKGTLPQETLTDILSRLPIKIFDPFPKIVGSSNGLVCLDISSCYARGFVLWNIARKQYSCLPRPRINDSRRPFWMVSPGFGFDRKKNDYKVVRIVSFGCEKDESSVVMAEVFSWRTFCWRVTEARIQKFIVSFDLDTEEFRRIPIPDFPAGICVKIMGFKGSLALAFYPSKEVDVHSRHGRPGVADWIEFCVWDDSDGADGKCWTKLSSIQLTTVGYPVGVANETGLIIKKLMEGQGAQFILFDPSNQNYRGMHICDASYSCDVHSYVESLVPVNGGGHDQVIEEELSEVKLESFFPPL